MKNSITIVLILICSIFVSCSNATEEELTLTNQQINEMLSGGEDDQTPPPPPIVILKP